MYLKKYFNLFDKLNLLFFILTFLGGVFWYKYDLPPRPLIRDIAQRALTKSQPHKYKSHNNINYHGYKVNNSYEETKLTYAKYEIGVPIFVDKKYKDVIGDSRLERLFLIQIRRHETKDIVIDSQTPITIYRIVPKKYSNFNHDFKMTDIKVLIPGHSTTHVQVLKKRFRPGKIILAPGGPIASSPILFSVDQKLPQIKTFRLLKQ